MNISESLKVAGMSEMCGSVEWRQCKWQSLIYHTYHTVNGIDINNDNRHKPYKWTVYIFGKRATRLAYHITRQLKRMTMIMAKWMMIAESRMRAKSSILMVFPLIITAISLYFRSNGSGSLERAPKPSHAWKTLRPNFNWIIMTMWLKWLEEKKTLAGSQRTTKLLKRVSKLFIGMKSNCQF